MVRVVQHRNREYRGFEEGYNANTTVSPRDLRKSHGFHSHAGFYGKARLDRLL